ncbi:MAG: prepilin-type N-terminal cleavage/methylation domain-containing protein [Candidatus Eisenbacteria bacterium]
MRTSRVGANAGRQLAGQSGFTLTEVMIVAAISIVVIMAVAVAYEGTVRSWNGTAALLEIQREASLGMEAIQNNVRPASSILVWPGVNSDSLQVFYPTLTGESLAARYNLDGNGNLIDINGTTVAANIDSIRFTLQGGTALHIDVWLRSDIGTPERTTDDQNVFISSTAVIRN